MGLKMRKEILASGLTFSIRDDGPTIKEAETLLSWYGTCIDIVSEGLEPARIIGRLKDYIALGFVQGIDVEDLDEMKAADAADVADLVSAWLSEHWPAINRMVNFVGKLPRPGAETDAPGPGNSDSPESPDTAE